MIDQMAHSHSILSPMVGNPVKSYDTHTCTSCPYKPYESYIIDVHVLCSLREELYVCIRFGYLICVRPYMLIWLGAWTDDHNRQDKGCWKDNTYTDNEDGLRDYCLYVPAPLHWILVQIDIDTAIHVCIQAA